MDTNDRAQTKYQSSQNDSRHKFSECRRVTAAWGLLRSILSTILQGRRRLSFDDLIRPVLLNANRQQKIQILKFFINYVTFVMNCDNAVDIDELDRSSGFEGFEGANVDMFEV